MMDWLQLMVSGGSPALCMAFLWLWQRRDREELREDIREIKAAIPLCQKERRREEADLHGRITGIQDRLAYLEGKRNGAKK